MNFLKKKLEPAHQLPIINFTLYPGACGFCCLFISFFAETKIQKKGLFVFCSALQAKANKKVKTSNANKMKYPATNLWVQQ